MEACSRLCTKVAWSACISTTCKSSTRRGPPTTRCRLELIAAAGDVVCRYGGVAQLASSDANYRGVVRPAGGAADSDGAAQVYPAGGSPAIWDQAASAGGPQLGVMDGAATQVGHGRLARDGGAQDIGGSTDGGSRRIIDAWMAPAVQVRRAGLRPFYRHGGQACVAPRT